MASSTACIATRSGQPRPTRATVTLSATLDFACAGARDVVAIASLPASETTMSFAVFGPMPDTLRNAASSSSATACARSAGLMAASTPIALLGPTPETPRSRSKTCNSSASAKP